MIAITKQRIAFAVSCLGFAAVLLAGVKDHTGTRPQADPETPAENAGLHPVIIKPGPETPRVLTTQTNYAGQVALASCSSCHTTTTPNRNTASSEQLLKFHQGMTYAHGNQSCLNCHNEADYDSLRLANGSSLPYVDVMKLCGQCHGPQLRDYGMGLHGGMNGYWDRTRGARTRNNCVDCHDPHNPAYPTVQPVLPPKDRIAVPKKTEHGRIEPTTQKTFSELRRSVRLVATGEAQRNPWCVLKELSRPEAGEGSPPPVSGRSMYSTLIFSTGSVLLHPWLPAFVPSGLSA